MSLYPEVYASLTPISFGSTFSYIYTAAVPEPTTWILMIAGFGGIGSIMRRRPNPGFAARYPSR